MMQPGLVSIVIPTYNDERFISEALSSLFAQTYHQWEAIIIDDGSSDSSVKIAQSFGDRVKVFSQNNAGSAVARNHGMRMASGQYLAFLDADDYWLPDKLRLQVEYLDRHPQYDFVYCAWREWFWPKVPEPQAAIGACGQESATADEVVASESGWVYPSLLLDCFIQTSTVLMRRSVVDRVGWFDESLRRGQDYDYWLRCAHVVQIFKLAQVSSLYRLREDSITKRVHPVNYGAVVLERTIRRWGIHDSRAPRVSAIAVRKHLSKVWRNFAIGHSEIGSRRTALYAASRAVRWWPFDLNSWRCLIRYLLLPAAILRR